MTYTLRPAKRDQAKPLIGLYSESGRGKTWSALLLARGFAGPKGKIGMIETESGRGEAYVGVDPVGEYLVCPIRGNFSPKEYGAAISACEAEKLDVLIIDSASHEWEAVGGVLDMAAQNQEAGKKGPLVWQKPKMTHQKEFTLRLMMTPIPLVIVNMRAKYPMLQVTAEVASKMRAAGKKAPEVGEWVRSEQLEPKQSEDILFEMFVHAWIDDEHRIHVTKYPKAIPAFKDILKNGEPITTETGQRLAAWAKGQAAPQTDDRKEVKSGEATSAASTTPAKQATTEYLTEEQRDELAAEMSKNGKDVDRFLANVSRRYKVKVESLAGIKVADLPAALEYARTA